MKTVLLFILTISIFRVNAQNTANKAIEVKQLGKHSNRNFFNFTLSSKKIYYFDTNGLILKSIKYGRHHYAYLRVVGRVQNYHYENDVVIEIDTTYHIKNDEIFIVSIDTLPLDFILKNPKYNYAYTIYDTNQHLTQSRDGLFRVKKYKYKKNGLMYKIIYYHSDDENNLTKIYSLVYRWKNIRGLSKSTIQRLNNFILWQHDLG